MAKTTYWHTVSKIWKGKEPSDEWTSGKLGVFFNPKVLNPKLVRSNSDTCREIVLGNLSYQAGNVLNLKEIERSSDYSIRERAKIKSRFLIRCLGRIDYKQINRINRTFSGIVVSTIYNEYKNREETQISCNINYFSVPALSLIMFLVKYADTILEGFFLKGTLDKVVTQVINNPTNYFPDSAVASYQNAIWTMFGYWLQTRKIVMFSDIPFTRDEYFSFNGIATILRAKANVYKTFLKEFINAYGIDASKVLTPKNTIVFQNWQQVFDYKAGIKRSEATW